MQKKRNFIVKALGYLNLVLSHHVIRTFLSWYE